jgi:hypothetical protein
MALHSQQHASGESENHSMTASAAAAENGQCSDLRGHAPAACIVRVYPSESSPRDVKRVSIGLTFEL